jgi:hypothetical protein
MTGDTEVGKSGECLGILIHTMPPFPPGRHDVGPYKKHLNSGYYVDDEMPNPGDNVRDRFCLAGFVRL